MVKALDEILRLERSEFGVEFYRYLVEKRNNQVEMNEIEEASFLIISMLLDIEMEGFVDLFYQFYSLRECAIVEKHLRHLGLEVLANQFSEAKNLYTNGNRKITEEEYRDIDPFDGDARWQKFDEIGRKILEKDSEIYQIDERVCEWVKANAQHLIICTAQ